MDLMKDGEQARKFEEETTSLNVGQETPNGGINTTTPQSKT